MKIYDNNLDVDDKDNWLKITDFENFFNIYEDKNGNYKYNLNSSLYFEVDENQLDEFQLKHDMYWPLISYQVYGTTRLAWLLMKLNKVQANEIFTKRSAGEKIKVFSNELVQNIVADINDFQTT